jgi:hypothetical protein
MGLDFDRLFPNKFLKAGEFDGRAVTLTIASVALETLVPASPGKKGEKTKKTETKAIVHFKETPKWLALNKTNALCLKAMWGRDTGAWVGKRVTLFPDMIQQFEGRDIAIRVKGSPDIAGPVTFTLRLARKTPREITLERTGKGAASAPPPPAAAEPSSPPEPQFDEPPEDMRLPGEAPPDDYSPPGGAA